MVQVRGGVNHALCGDCAGVTLSLLSGDVGVDRHTIGRESLVKTHSIPLVGAQVFCLRYEAMLLTHHASASVEVENLSCGRG